MARGGIDLKQSPTDKESLKLHRDSFVADLHCDTVLRLVDGVDLSVRGEKGHIDLPRLKEGGVGLQVMACWLDTDTPRERCRPRVDRLLDALDELTTRESDRVARCTTAAQAREIHSQGRIALLYGIENGVAIAGDLNNLDHFYERGVRCMTLTHMASSDWCESSSDAPSPFNGLTDFGRDVVRRMNELGMMVDVSHASPRAVEEVLEVSTDPIIASHSCVHALCAHDRNLTDDQIRAIADCDGMIGVNFFTGFLSDQIRVLLEEYHAAHREELDAIAARFAGDPDGREAAEKPFRVAFEKEAAARTHVDLALLCDHIEYIARLIGPEHVGLGSDFDGMSLVPDGLDDCSMLPNITVELMQRGFGAADVKMVLGENFLRVFAQVCDR